ncbi:MAG: SH3 domain-containing protein [Firmicutes bacterium]|nr:SH3 domain-containing protein [Bacillota bacterium]
MPRIYLSPSLQPWNQTVLGVSEEFLMNMIADAAEPLLKTNGIDYVRSRIGMTLNEVIAESNAGNFDAHVAIHSNAAPEPGSARGSRQYFFTTSSNGKRLAENFRDEFKMIYPEPDRVTINPTTDLAELRQTKAPAVHSEVAFHDNILDAQWIQNNIQSIAIAIVKALAKYFGIEYRKPCMQGTMPVSGTNWTFNGFQWAEVCTNSESLNIRSAPNGNVLFVLSRGAQVIITGAAQDEWVPVRFNYWDGWASSRFICACNIERPVTPPIAPVPPTPPIPPIVIPPIIEPPVAPVPPIGTVPPIVIPPVPPIVVPPVQPPSKCGDLPTMACLAQVRTQGGNLHLRSAPTLTSNIITRMPNGTRILVLGEHDGWYYVFYDNQFGWANKDYVRFY